MVVVTRYVPQPSIRTSIIHSAQPTALHPFLRWQGNWLEWIPSHTRPSTRFVSQLNPIAIVYPFIHPGPHWLQFPQRSAPRESVLSVHARLDNFFPKWASLINITTQRYLPRNDTERSHLALFSTAAVVGPPPAIHLTTTSSCSPLSAVREITKTLSLSSQVNSCGLLPGCCCRCYSDWIGGCVRTSLATITASWSPHWVCGISFGP